MPMFTGADYYIRHPQEEVDSQAVDTLTVEQITSAVKRASLSNSDLYNEALRKADSYSFQVAHPELLRTAENTRLINHWLKTKGITNPTYPDFDAAYRDLTADGVLSLELAREKKEYRTYKGALTGQTYDSIESMIAQERQAALRTIPEATAEERILEALPLEQAQTVLREGERREHLKTKVVETRKNGDAWITINPWYVDNQHNARLMKMQLAANGWSEDAATIEQFEICGRQLRESGLLTTNKAAVAKEYAAEIQQRAAEAVKQPGSAFDEMTVEQIENLNLPLEEIRRRANGIFA